MAKRRPPFIVALHMPEADTRPAGGLRFADPSMVPLTGQVHTFNEPHSGHGYEHNGIRSMGRYGDPYGEMQRKKGFGDGSEE